MEPSQSGTAPFEDAAVAQLEKAVDGLSIGVDDDEDAASVEGGSPSRSFRERRYSHSTAPTFLSSSRTDSDFSSWDQSESGRGEDSHSASECDDDEHATSSQQQLSSRSMPTTPLKLTLSRAQGQREGRKRSLTDVLSAAERDEDRSRLAAELVTWINSSPSPYETDLPPGSPLPRPFPLFPSQAQKPFAPAGGGQLNDLGLPLPPRSGEQQFGTVKAKKRSYGFIPGPMVPPQPKVEPEEKEQPEPPLAAE